MTKKIGNEPRITLNEWLANEARWEKREGVLLTELTRLLLHIAPEVEPASDVIDVYWQVDNAVCGLLKESHLTQRAVDDATHCACGLGLLPDGTCPMHFQYIMHRQ